MNSGPEQGAPRESPRHVQDTSWIHRMLKAALDKAPVPLILLDDQQHCLHMNAAAENLTGYTLTELQGRSLHSVLHGTRSEGNHHHIKKCPLARAVPDDDQEQGEDTFVHKDGHTYPVAYTLSSVRDGERAGTILEVRGVTVEEAADRSLPLDEERFRTFMTTNSSIIWTTDSDGALRDASRWEDYTGQPPEEFQGWGWLNRIHPDDREEVRRTWARATESGTSTEFEYRLRHRSGEYRHVRTSAAPLRDSRGGVREWIGTITDIHDRKRTDEARLRLAAIIESSDDAIASKNLDGIITSWNAAAERIFGYTAQEVIGQPVTMIIPPDRQQEETTFLARLRRGERIDHFETVRQRKDGTLLDISLTISPIIDLQGRVIGASKVARDITEHKRAEAALEEQARTLETLNRVAASVSAELDLQRLVQTVTDAGTELSGAQFGAFFYNVLDERGESYTLYTLSGAPREAFERYPMPRNTHVFGPTFRGEGVVRSDDITEDPRYGQNPPYQGMPEGHLPVRSYLAVPVISRSGEVTGGLFFGHAEAGVFSEKVESVITALASHAATAMDNAHLYEQARRLNETLEDKVEQRTSELRDLNQELESFNYSVSHDLRAPLRSIDGFSQALIEDYGEALDDTALGYLKRIRAGVMRMGALTDSLLDLSHLLRVRLAPRDVDLGDLARDVVEELREREPEREVDVVIEDVPAFGDPGLLRIVLENLLGNALKFTQGRERARIEVGATEHEGQMAYFVRDNGAGFDMEYADKLFVPFQRLHRVEEFEGTGIGLSIVQRIVHRHGGRIWAAGEPGAGATVYFTLQAR